MTPRRSEVVARELSLRDVIESMPWPAPDDHKYSRGVVGMVTGSDRYPGAAVLGVRGAQAVGVGMVRYLGPRRCEDLVLTAAPEVVMGEGRVQAWVVGSGVAPDDAERQMQLQQAAMEHRVPLVVDAGALHRAAEWARHTPVVLTPHAGELAQILGWPREAVETDPEDAARQVAEAESVTVVLKGASTVVHPAPAERESGERPAVLRTGTPWLATAGTGDVLAGMVGGLMAQGLAPVSASVLAVALHGEAGRRASGGGPLTAGDLPRHVRAVVAEHGAARGF